MQDEFDNSGDSCERRTVTLTGEIGPGHNIQKTLPNKNDNGSSGPPATYTSQCNGISEEQNCEDLLTSKTYPEDGHSCENGTAQQCVDKGLENTNNVDGDGGRLNEILLENECECNNVNGIDKFKPLQDKNPTDESREIIATESINNDRDIDDSVRFDLLSKSSRSVVLKILGYLPFKDLVHKVSLVCKTWHSMAFDPSLWSKIDLRKYVVNDNVMSKLPQLCNFINYILLPDARNDDFTDNGLISLAKGCPLLTTFFAPRCGTKFSDEAIIAFTEHCKELKELHMDALDVSDAALRSIAHNLTKLEYLSVSQVGPITNEGIAEIIKYCRNLRELITNQNHQITDECFTTIPESSKSLRRLEVMMCNIKPTGVPMIGELHNLEMVNLTQCTNLTAEYLIPLLKGCKKLYSLSLNLDKFIDDRCIDIILTHLPNLQYIFLVSTVITDEALHIMGRKGKSLVRVDLGYTKVTEVGARSISEMCSTLEYLGLMRCDLIPESVVEELVVQYPHILYSTFIQDTKRLLKRVEEEEAAEKAQKEQAQS